MTGEIESIRSHLQSLQRVVDSALRDEKAKLDATQTRIAQLHRGGSHPARQGTPS